MESKLEAEIARLHNAANNFELAGSWLMAELLRKQIMILKSLL